MLLLWGIEVALLVACVGLLAALLDELDGAARGTLALAWQAFFLGVSCALAWMLGLLLVMT